MMLKESVVAFVGLSLLTYVLAWALWRRGNKMASAAVVVLSPFPCPSGFPC